MRPTLCFVLVLALTVIGTSSQPARAQQQANPRPKEFAIIFNMGYAADKLPKDKAAFTKLVQGLKKAHFNIVLCKYEDWRAEICRKQGIKIMVDLLVPGQHIYRDVEGAKALCRKLRDNPAVSAYHLWSDRIGGTAKGRSRDVNNVHKWDATHPTYVGGYNARALESLVKPNLIGYYDFHWRRGGHWRHLFRAHSAAKKTDAYFFRYLQPDPGKIGAGNYNRVLYTISTSLAFGLKGYTYHYRSGMLNPQTGELGALGKDLARVNAQVAPLGSELMKLGNPTAVYSTPITKTAKDRPTGQAKPTVPGEFKGIPANHWVKVTQGEAIVGLFHDAKKQDVLFLANHNAYQPQKMELHFPKGVEAVQLFDRQKQMWRPLPAKSTRVQFELPPAMGELVRVTR